MDRGDCSGCEESMDGGGTAIRGVVVRERPMMMMKGSL